MGSTASWQEAWDNAQPRLASIRDTLNATSSPDPRVIRVGQLDSELLDHELVYLLQEPLSKALALFNASLTTRFEPELSLLIRLTLYKLSTWRLGASYGAKLQDLRYYVPHSPSLSLSPSGLPRRTLIIHGTLTILVPYCHTRLRAHALSHAWPDTPSSDRKRKAWDILTSLESSHTLLGLLNFIAFLWDGRYRTITDRLLNMRLVPSHKLVKRDVSYEFMNRQMVWHAFTEFLLFLLPLISARSVRHRLNRLISHLSLTSLTSILSTRAAATLGIPTSQKSVSGQGFLPGKRGKYWLLPQDQCAICAENSSFSLNLTDPANAFTSLAAPFNQYLLTDKPPQTPADSDTEPPAYPIHTPYVTSCGDVYCYHCIAERMMHSVEEDGSEWECLRCGKGVKWVERLLIDVGGASGSEMSGSEYEFSSDMDLDVTDMSESGGSYSELGLSD